MDVTLYDLTEATVAIRASLMKEKYELSQIDATVLQATLEDLDDKGYIIVQKDDLKELVEGKYGEWSDKSYSILEQIGIDPTEGI